MRPRMKSLVIVRKSLIGIGFLVLAQCASKPATTPAVLEPVNGQASVPTGNEDSGVAISAVDPALAKLKDLLSKLGYEGVGLEFESADTLALLQSVFSDKRTANKDIRFIYTGITMAYDAGGKALTIGGTRDVQSVITFISKKVPVLPVTKP